MSETETPKAAEPPPAEEPPLPPEKPTLWERLRALWKNGKANGANFSTTGAELAQTASAMMRNLIEFEGLKVEDVMVPRADIIAIEETATVRELIERFTLANHSRLPVYRESLDDLTGMVHIKDFMRWVMTTGAAKTRRRGSKAAEPQPQGLQRLALTATSLATPIKEMGVMRELLYVPPSMAASDLLVKMQSTHIHMAIVIDEYGGTDGLVSIEDLVEEIVGDIADEHDTDEETLIREAGEGMFIADARAPIEDLEKLLSIDLLPDEREEDIDTLGGLVFSMLGRVPVRGEIVRHASGIEFEVLESDPRRVKKIRIHTRPRGPKRRSKAEPEPPKAAAE